MFKYKKILITGGAGFLGSNLSLLLKEKYSEVEIVALDNLKRRGSELSLPRLKEKGINFIHGDIRNKEDLLIKDLDLIIECSAEPSVLAGTNGGNPEYLLNTNLMGALNCLELARRAKADFFFVSTSRIYPYKFLNQANIIESSDRFDFGSKQKILGLTENGVNENFPILGARSLYGCTKLASELFIDEYADNFGIKTLINRFGCITGPWQMGKVDQGVLALWVYKHLFQQPLSYIGFGGEGKQVRDFIHIDDALEIIDLQLNSFDKLNGELFNVGGGKENSVSLKELTQICQSVTGNKVVINKIIETRPVDLKVYVTDNEKISKKLNWKPKKNIQNIVIDTHKWIKDNYQQLYKLWN